MATGSLPRTVFAFVDGGCRPNPGRAVCAALLTDSFGNTLAHQARDLGQGTNVTAEWGGVELALETALALGVTDLVVCGDNEGVMAAAFGQPNDSTDHATRERVQRLRRQFGVCSGRYIPRERNAAADYLCDSVFDGTYRPFEDRDADDELIDFSYVVHVRVPAAPYADRTSRNKLKATLSKSLRAGLPVASIELKRVF